jgi:hypothetical protein
VDAVGQFVLFYKAVSKSEQDVPVVASLEGQQDMEQVQIVEGKTRNVSFQLP